MREIKLRAWDEFNQTMVYSSEEDSCFILENGEWSVKYIREKNMTVDGIEIDAPVWHESDEIEVMQYTGLKDKNDKEIYKGDIVYSSCTNFCQWVNAIVTFSNGSYRLELPNKTWVQNWNSDDLLVIGNIYQNEELIQNKELITNGKL